MTHDLAVAVSELVGRMAAAGYEPDEIRHATLARAEGLLAGRLGTLTRDEHREALAAVSSAVDCELGRRLAAAR